MELFIKWKKMTEADNKEMKRNKTFGELLQTLCDGHRFTHRFT